MQKRTLSFVCPAFNERESLPELITELEALGTLLQVPYEIVIVDDGSTDGTANFLAERSLITPHLYGISLRKNYGKATALYVGFQQARGEVVVTLDADLQNDPNEVPKLLAELGNFDIVSGWKFDRPDVFEKTFASRIFNGITRRVSGLPLHDFNSGIKAYTREAAQSLVLYGELHRYIPVLANAQGFSITEVKTHTRERKYGETKYRSKRYARGFFDLFTVLFLTKYARRPLHFFGSFGTILSVVGIGILLYLTGVKVFAHQAIGSRPLLTFGVLFTLVGIQLFFTGLLAELLVRTNSPRLLPIRHEWRRDGPLT